MSKQTCILGFGKANLPGTYASIACFRLKPPFMRDSAVNSGRQDRNYSRDYAIGAIEERGMLYQRRVEHETGTVVMLQSGWKRNGSPIRDGAIFLRLREDATEWRITAKLPLSDGNTYGAEFVVFEGRADMLNADELQTFGFEVNRSYRSRFMAREEIDECFLLQILSQERSARPSLMIVGTGEQRRLVEVAAAPSRRLVLRKRG